MPRLSPISDEEAAPEVRALFEKDIARDGLRGLECIVGTDHGQCASVRKSAAAATPDVRQPRAG